VQWCCCVDLLLFGSFSSLTCLHILPLWAIFSLPWNLMWVVYYGWTIWHLFIYILWINLSYFLSQSFPKDRLALLVLKDVPTWAVRVALCGFNYMRFWIKKVLCLSKVIMFENLRYVVFNQVIWDNQIFLKWISVCVGWDKMSLDIFVNRLIIKC